MANDKNNFKIQLFEGQKVRTVWSEEDQQWYFSIIDICWILADSKDYDTARKYWNKLKQRLVEEGNESVTDCHQLKLVSPKDGKRYLTDVATQPQLFRIIQSIPSKKAEPFKQWMAQVASDLTTDKNARKLAAITITAAGYGGDMSDEQAYELLDDIDFHFNKVKCNKIERLTPILNQLVVEEMRYIAGMV